MEIVIYPDPRLREPCKDVTEITPEFKAKIRGMFEIMYEARGVGLAATQVGWTARVFVLNMAAEPPTDENDGEEVVCVNPSIVAMSGRSVEEEGCLSFPGIRGKVVRAANVKLEYFNEKGEAMVMEQDGFPAAAIQHETDHLDGILFVNKMTRASRLKVARRMKELEDEFAASADVIGLA